MKIVKCTKCGIEQDQSLYQKDKHNKSGYKMRCKQCISEYTKNFFKKNPYKSNKEYNQRTIEWRRNHRKKIKEKYGFGSGYWRYGIDLMIEVYKKYDSCCDICKTKENLTLHHLDGRGRHYHERGYGKMNNNIDNLQLLCRSCHGYIDSRKWQLMKKSRT